MLVTLNYKKNDVLTIKLSTGEEIVARFDSFDTQNTLDVIKPTVLTLNPQTGAVMLIPWIMSIDVKSSEPVKIKQSQIVAIAKPNKQVAGMYMQGTSGIAMPDAIDTEARTSLL